MRCSLLLIAALAVAPLATAAAAPSFTLDADSPTTGSGLNTAPLLTPFGTVTFAGEIRDRGTDADFNTAGAAGNVFDVADTNFTAQLSFDFDVSSLTFINGGNFGGISIEARDAGGLVVDSFAQANTDNGQPAGPVILDGGGIRSLVCTDTSGGVFAPWTTFRASFRSPDRYRCSRWAARGRYAVAAGADRRSGTTGSVEGIGSPSDPLNPPAPGTHCNAITAYASAVDTTAHPASAHCVVSTAVHTAGGAGSTPTR